MGLRPVAPCLALAALLAAVAPAAAQVGVCQPYTGATCAGILPAGYSVWTNTSAQLAIQEAGVAAVKGSLAIISGIDPRCYSAFMNYSCTTYLPHCASTGNTPQFQCLADCQNAATLCTNIFNIGGRPDQIPTCITVPNGAPPNTPYPTTDCFTLLGGQSNGSEPVVCPVPLIRNPYNGTKTPVTCPAENGQCCFPCPVADLLYPTWQDPQKAQTVVAILNVVSMVLLIVVLALWSTRDGVWTQSRMLTVMFSLLNALGLAAVNGLVLLTQRYAMQCMSSVETSINAPWCTFEGFMYGFFGIGFSWSEALFNINLFLIMWFKRDPIPAVACYIAFPLIWLISGILNMVPFIVSGSAYNFGIHCAPQNLALFRNMSLLPLIAGLCVSIFLGFANVLYVCKMAWDIYVRKDTRYFSVEDGEPLAPPPEGTKREFTPEQKAMLPSFWSSGGGVHATGNARMDTFAMCWRTSILSFTVALAFLVFVIYWFTDAEPKLLAATSGDFAQANAAWAGDWLACLLANAPNGQDACYQIPKPYIPDWYWSYATDVLSALPGIFYYITLGTDPSDYKRLVSCSCLKRKGGAQEADGAEASEAKPAEIKAADGAAEQQDVAALPQDGYANGSGAGEKPPS
ncbi:hypothetical protein DFJ74DRAFT_695406 [Hyaloraphidium curvatum]|nr:hypothetical protein DFJ74DRAFT_695406 [Hyaloraphidium curvatum]